MLSIFKKRPKPSPGLFKESLEETFIKNGIVDISERADYSRYANPVLSNTRTSDVWIRVFHPCYTNPDIVKWGFYKEDTNEHFYAAVTHPMVRQSLARGGSLKSDRYHVTLEEKTWRVKDTGNVSVEYVIVDILDYEPGSLVWDK